MPVFYRVLMLLLENVFFKILLALGLSFATYKGLDGLFEIVKSEIISNFMNLDSVMLQILGILKIDKAITIIFSAYLIKITLSGFVAGAKTSMGFGGK